MAKERSFVPGYLIIGLLYRDQEVLAQVLKELEQHYGPIAEHSESGVFTPTSYYNEELGGVPQRLFVRFAELVDPSTIAAIKRESNSIEDRWSLDDGRRQINIDPGILSLNSVILATAKGRTHRVPLSQGIWADLTLHWCKGEFIPLEWTYADYRDSATRALFTRWRETLKQELTE
ncbi:MAG TPA: DUF4416 family protein [Sphaerochaeta sp.]|nr:DUF4416 family protein [Sphaerochaeta sp.]